MLLKICRKSPSKVATRHEDMIQGRTESCESGELTACRVPCLRPDFENQFLLHISRHPGSGKMLLQCMEGHRPDNCHSLGLTPQTYVPKTEALGEPGSWEGQI